MPFRRADATITKVERLDTGALRIPANLTRVGVFVYRKHDGTEQRELRLPEEVFHEDSMRTARAMPATDLHPAEGKVTISNYRQLARGHVGDNVRQDGTFLAADVIVSDGDAVQKVDSGERKELSCGYDCDLEFTAGEHEGERYDAIQRRIRYNHVALLPAGAGRAGSDVRLRLDAAGNEIDDSPPARPARTEKATIMTIRLDGIDYDPASTTFAQALQKHQERADATSTKLKDSETALAKAEARADAAEAKVKELQGKLDSAESPDALDKRVQERTKLIAGALKVLPADTKLDGLSDKDIRVKALQHKGIETEGRSDDYLQARFDGLVESAPGSSRSDDGNDLMGSFRRDSAGGRPSGGNGLVVTADMIES